MRTRTDKANIIYPITIANIMIIGFADIYGTEQRMPKIVWNDRLFGDCSFNF